MTNPATSERERECVNCGDRRLWHQPACGLCACAEYAPKETLAELRARADAAEAVVARVQSLADVVARLQPADPDTHDRDVSWLELLEALDPS